jgi:hypothetical protein
LGATTLVPVAALPPHSLVFPAMNLFTGLLLIALIAYILYLDADSLRRIDPDLYEREMKGP